MAKQKKETLQIVELRVENVMGLRAVEIHPESGKPIVLGGANGAGKSSILNSIVFAVGGEKNIPAKPIRDGEKDAEAMIDFGRFVVRRKMTAKGRYLEVTSKDGARYPSPQKMLDGFLGDAGVDLLDLLGKKPKDLATLIARARGVEDALNENAEMRNEIAAERHDAKKERDALKARIDAIVLPEIDPYPTAAIDVDALGEELANALQYDAQMSKLEQARSDLDIERERMDDHHRQKMDEIGDRITQLREQIKALEEEQTIREQQHKEEIDAHDEKTFAADRELSERAKKEFRPIATIREEIQSASTVNAAIEAAKRKTELETELSGNARYIARCEKRIEETDATRGEIIESMDIGIKGLAIEDNALHVDGIPFDQLSQSERIRVCVALAVKIDPTMRVLLLRDGSLLDDESMGEVIALAKKHRFQLWIERVGTGDEVSIVIHEGKIEEIR